MDPFVEDKILSVEPSNWGHQCDRQMMRLVTEEIDRAAPKKYKQNLASDLVVLSLNQGQGQVLGDKIGTAITQIKSHADQFSLIIHGQKGEEKE